MTEPVAFAWEAVVAADRNQFEQIPPESRFAEFPSGRPARAIPLDRPEVRIGRRKGAFSPEIDLDPGGPIGDPGTSRLHAFLERQADGSYVVVDNRSTAMSCRTSSLSA